ncbi:TPA: hypothetical protein DEO28_00560 [Candidatus Dependentiae bacterium]|nr:MAG: hypothetical protein UR14_C0001G0037 [candidate division TM6 bacterium GW2011_GWE2_31_21]KKP54083.1 MAG: hypothetical protein UR43_C0001G0101 [candidate division TM6 bacterium GW2011_GWF2_33_332]HBS48335.1 hypothetical protein [Candidatus Dependentiae bacterium]HBZ72991.1 hypothetical protein [Candidatus Dependentiae bacterium]
MKNDSLVPVQLWEGDNKNLVEKTIAFLQLNFCINKSIDNFSECYCNNCRKLKSFSHSSVLWLKPQKSYSVDLIEQIFEKIQFNLDKDQKFFFVLEKAHLLTAATANKILKILEEPPVGYNFILLTNNIKIILPTIKSRSLIKQFPKAEFEIDFEEYPLLKYFIEKQKLNDPITFESDLKKLELNETDSLEILNILFNYFSKKQILCDKNETKEYALNVVNFIKKQILIPPQSGSSNLFWKNVYLNFPQK